MSAVPPSTQAATRRSTWLDVVERVCNRLPNPITLFVLLAGLVLVASAVVSSLGWTVAHPRDGSPIAAVNLLSRANVQRCFTESVKNFVEFAPLGIVLVAMIGVGVADRGGLIAATLSGFVRAVPPRFLTAAIVFAGIMSHVAGDAGLIIVPPIAAVLFVSAGRHPIAGIAAAFAGVGGAFSATLLPTMLDVVLANMSQNAVTDARLSDAAYRVNILGNYYFMLVSALLLTLVATLVTTRIIEPRLGPWRAPADTASNTIDEDPPHVARRGLRAAVISIFITFALIALLVLPPDAPLRATAGDTLIQRIEPFLSSMVVWILLLFLIPGIAYGVSAGRIRSDHDVARLASESMNTMGGYIVLAFFAAQFIKYFAWSNLGAMLAVAGADLLRAMNFHGTPLLLCFVIFLALLNLFITSASAKWAVIAPVFVPMFMQLGYTPEATQLVFRIGESCTNIVTPLFPYLPLILGFCRRYDPNMRNGSLLALMLPYSLAFLVAWSALLVTWIWLALPIGPDVGLRL